MSSTIDPAKLKVVDLRQELSNRGLDSKGNKAALVKRLKDALEKELKKELPDTSIADTSTEDLDTSRVEDSASPNKESSKVPVTKEEAKPPEKPKESQDSSGDNKDGETAEESAQEEENEEKADENGDNVEKEEEKSSRKSRWGDNEAEESSEQKQDIDDDEENRENEEDKSEKDADDKSAAEDVEMKDDEDKKGEKRKRESSPSGRSQQRRRSRSPVKEDEPAIDSEKVQLSWYDSDLHLQLDKESFLSGKPLSEGVFGYVWSGARATHGVSTGKVCFEVKLTEELRFDDLQRQDRGRNDRDRHGRDRRDRDRRDRRESDRKDQKNGKSDSKEKDDKTKDDKEETIEKMDTEEGNKSEDQKQDDEVKEEEVTKEGEETKETEDVQEKDEKSEETSQSTDEKETTEDVAKTEENAKPGEEEEAKPEEEEAKVEDEAKVEEESKGDDKMETEEPKKETEPIPERLFRVGFSLLSTGLQLGEFKHSYAYESSGKFVMDKAFKDFGNKYGVGDVIGAFVDIDEDEVTFSFTVNGVQQEETITVPRSELPEENFALFPHVLSRNFAFEMNLGSREEPWFPIPEALNEYTFVDKVEDKVAGPHRPEARTDCEIILMIGLPCSGKTHWVNEYLASNPGKEYTVIGHSTLLERMTVAGEEFKSRFKGRWNFLMDRIQYSLNKLTDIASLRRRNYIIDRTNVLPSQQRRKLRQFEGFKRRAIVVVVTDEEQARRQALVEDKSSKDDSTMLDMKANFGLPSKSDDFIDEITYAEQDEEESKKLVKKYNEDGKAAGYGKRNNFRDRRPYRNNYRDRGPQRYDRRPQSGNWNRRNDYGRDRRDNRGPPPRDWGRQGDRNRDSSRNSGGGYNRNRQSGGWSGSPWSSQGGGAWQQGYNQGGYNQGGWGGGSGNWKYGQGGYGSGYGGGGGGNWNYYDQYPQNWKK